MKKITDYAHDAFLPMQKDGIYADFTLGEGNDADFFLSYPVKKVYGFEIQEETMQRAKQKIQDERMVFIEDGHENLDRYLDEKLDGAIFNFGYDPKGDKKITTKLETSKIAVEKALNVLKPKGRCVLVCYEGHEEGKKEADYFLDYVRHLPSKPYSVMKLTMENKKLCPFILIIEKNGSFIS